MYFKLMLIDVPSDLEAEVSDFCFENGCGGIVENLDFQQSSDRYEPETLTKDKINLEVYFEMPPHEDFLFKFKNEFSDIQYSMTQEESKDWLEEWKKGFESFELVNNIWVVPSWLTPPKGIRDYLRVDPGMAFGTGTHATTQLASGFLYEIINSNTFTTMIDVGTGSGILSLLASKLGVQKIEGTEIDKEACRVANENAELNQCEGVEFFSVGTLQSFSGPYDIVVANIIDGVLVDLKEDLKRLTPVGGYLVLTGILEERDKLFFEKFDFQDFEVLKKDLKDEWIGYLCQRKS